MRPFCKVCSAQENKVKIYVYHRKVNQYNLELQWLRTNKMKKLLSVQTWEEFLPYQMLIWSSATNIFLKMVQKHHKKWA